MNRQGGAALLLVMWVVLLLAGLVAGYAMASRIESLQGNGVARGLVGTLQLCNAPLAQARS